MHIFDQCIWKFVFFSPKFHRPKIDHFCGEKKKRFEQLIDASTNSKKRRIEITTNIANQFPLNGLHPVIGDTVFFQSNISIYGKSVEI